MAVLTGALRAAPFLIFVVAAVWLVRHTDDGATRRGRARLFVGIAALLSLLPGLAGRSAWPFSSWPMDNGLMPRELAYIEAVAVDARGREWPVDPRAFEPMPWVDLSSWFARHATIDGPTAAAIGPTLLHAVRASLARAARGEPVGVYARRLGPLAAPATVLVANAWDRGAESRPDDIAQLRVYEVTADLDGPVSAASASPRRLRFAWPAP